MSDSIGMTIRSPLLADYLNMLGLRLFGLTGRVAKQLLELARPMLESLIHEVTGVKALCMHHDISTVTAEEIVVSKALATSSSLGSVPSRYFAVSICASISTRCAPSKSQWRQPKPRDDASNGTVPSVRNDANDLPRVRNHATERG
ncbi:MAG: hypothetical protein C0483_00020 [Pirellula sp.]|nr:hypothetical protein [Pirellula sp.]